MHTLKRLSGSTKIILRLRLHFDRKNFGSHLAQVQFSNMGLLANNSNTDKQQEKHWEAGLELRTNYWPANSSLRSLKNMLEDRRRRMKEQISLEENRTKTSLLRELHKAIEQSQTLIDVIQKHCGPDRLQFEKVFRSLRDK